MLTITCRQLQLKIKDKNYLPSNYGSHFKGGHIMYCKNCGNEVKLGKHEYNYCSKCGAKLNEQNVSEFPINGMSSVKKNSISIPLKS